jgi:YegS/Rv2252/BmrU family lipid kinase
MSRRLRLIVNPHSGGGRALAALPQVEAAFVRLGREYDIHRTTSLEHGRELARAGVAAGETLVTLSGDGLIGAIAGAITGLPDALLGILPSGRGNDLARILGIPLHDLDAACAIAAGDRERWVDLGYVGEAPFIGIASLGFDSDANRIANAAPAWLGQAVYAYAAVRALAAWKPARFDLEVDGAPPRSVTGYSVGLANNKAYGGGMLAAPHAELDDGLLDMVVCGEMSKTRFLTQVLPRVFKGTHVNLPEVQESRARAVTVRADRPFTIFADGDPIAELGPEGQTISIVPHAVRVLVPAS